jgi:hypothetical protein
MRRHMLDDESADIGRLLARTTGHWQPMGFFCKL